MYLLRRTESGVSEVVRMDVRGGLERLVDEDWAPPEARLRPEVIAEDFLYPTRVVSVEPLRLPPLLAFFLKPSLLFLVLVPQLFFWGPFVFLDGRGFTLHLS